MTGRDQWIETAAKAACESRSFDDTRELSWDEETDAVHEWFREMCGEVVDVVSPQIEAAVRAQVLAEVQAAIASIQRGDIYDQHEPVFAELSERVRKIGASS